MPVQIRDFFEKLSIVLLVFLLSDASTLQAQEKPAVESEPPYRVGENVSRPEKISGAPPVYTELARKARVTGTVIVEAIIDEDGNVWRRIPISPGICGPGACWIRSASKEKNP